MNEILKAMQERRSYRKFKPDMLPREVIDQIIEAGLYAASGRNGQDAIVVAVTDPQERNRLAKVNAAIMGAESDPFYGAPVVLVVLADKNWSTHVYDGSLVMGNLMLAAHALGVGSCWIHRAKEEFEMPEYKELLQKLGVQGEYEGIGHCILGYPDCEAPKAAERKVNRVYYVE